MTRVRNAVHARTLVPDLSNVLAREGVTGTEIGIAVKAEVEIVATDETPIDAAGVAVIGQDHTRVIDPAAGRDLLRGIIVVAIAVTVARA